MEINKIKKNSELNNDKSNARKWIQDVIGVTQMEVSM